MAINRTGFKKPAWGEHNLFSENTYNPPSEPTSDAVAEATAYETPSESDTTNLVPQSGDEALAEVSSDGERTEVER